MKKAKINETTGEVLEEGYYCEGCPGCACHVYPPCNHCVNHSYQQGENVYEDENEEASKT